LQETSALGKRPRELHIAVYGVGSKAKPEIEAQAEASAHQITKIRCVYMYIHVRQTYVTDSG